MEIGKGEEARSGNRGRIDGRAGGCGRNVYGAMKIVKGRGEPKSELIVERGIKLSARESRRTWC